MARLSITNDTVARLCYEYMHGQLDAKTNEKIYNSACEVVDRKYAIPFVFEIAYRLGYAHSELADFMSEVTYKQKKKAIRENIKKIERSE